MFDLDKAISQWRASLSAQPSFRNSDLDELEDHLREEFAALKSSDLTEEEAFLISSRRLGTPEELSGEFAIADPKQRRGFRLSWMITGALALVFLWLAADVLTNFGAGALSRLPGEHVFAPGTFGLGWVAVAIRLGSLALGSLLIWRLLATDRSSRRLKKVTGGTVIAATLLLAFLALATRMGSGVFVSHSLPPANHLDFAITNGWINLLTLLALPVVLIIGLWRLVKS